MSGVDDAHDGLTRPRRAMIVSPSSTTIENFRNVEPSILASFSDRHRQTKGGIKFTSLNITERKEFYARVVDHVFNCPTTILTLFEATYRVAVSYNIVIADCDRIRIKASVNNHLKVATDL